eukprot:m.112274 g.112274  ORF g.112274 m.112274 type:complete len:903 (+) comp12781_c3_seq1:216-2924(+)
MLSVQSQLMHTQSSSHPRTTKPTMTSKSAAFADRETAPTLDNQWQRQQKKTFTAWVNSHLRKRNLHVDEISQDFRDGTNLLALLEIISEETVGKASRGKMKIHHIENVGKAMKFIQSKNVDVRSIGPEEVVDGNLKMILGLVWMLILRFEIQDISEDQLNAKDALLLWCQRKTEPYSNVDVQNFHMSWKDGLAFCALIHRHCPNLIDYNSLKKGNVRENLETAFSVAENELDIPRLLDVDDMVECVKPDERSIMTYVAAYYKKFASFNQSEVAGKKIMTVLETNMEHERLIQQYDTMSTALLEWIQQSIAMLNDRSTNFSSVSACQGKMTEHNSFRSDQIPSKLQEKAMLEEHYSTLQTKLRLSGRPPFVPSEGKEINDINSAWGDLETADNQHLTWLLEEFRRIQLAEAKAAAFNTKADSHDGWTNGLDAELAADDYSGANFAAVSALIKKHDAFQSDLMAHEQRVHEIGTLAQELDDLKYADADAVNDRYATIYENWQKLVELTNTRQQSLQGAEEKARHLDELYLQYARQAPPFGNFVQLAKEKLTEPYVVDTIAEVENLQSNHEAFKADLPQSQSAFDGLTTLHNGMSEIGSTDNPYSPHNYAKLSEQWAAVKELVEKRDQQLAEELAKQQERETLRKEWATAANNAEQWLVERTAEVKAIISSTSNESLEDQITQMQKVEADVNAFNVDELEALHKKSHENLIFDNPHTTNTMESVRGKLAGLKTNISGSINALNNQILARDSTNITDEQRSDWEKAFKHWDKDSSGFLEYKEFRAFLLSLGTFNIDSVPKDEGEDPEWDRIVADLDPNHDGKVSFDEFIAFMIKENADAASADELLGAFQTLANGNPYILASDMQRELSPELYEYCMQNMIPYSGGPEGALDYSSFAKALYGESEL